MGRPSLAAAKSLHGEWARPLDRYAFLAALQEAGFWSALHDAWQAGCIESWAQRFHVCDQWLVERRARIAQRVVDTEAELRGIAAEREAKEQELRQRRTALQASADTERRKLIGLMVPLLDKAQKLSQAADDIAHVCRDNQIEVPHYFGPSMFSIPGVRDPGGERRVKAGAKSRHDEWVETLKKAGIL